MKKIMVMTSICFLLAGILFFGACKNCECDEDVITIHVDQMVNVPGGGGSVDVTFNGSSGVRIRITLSCSNNSMRPYGYLQAPNGSGDYTPPNNASNGQNSAETMLNQNGTYTLTVFDGANIGGQVHVVIDQI
ncbi:MAG: hypothetical protein NTW95_03310 [Candidatus Aminicenantes bacterium]|nr:hypothetical protein [Candidatus Aminicenantes bacterium]